MSAKKRFIPVEEFLIDRLKDTKRARIFLELAHEEYLEDSDLNSFLNSLQFIAIAKGGTLQLKSDANMNIQNLQELLERTSTLGWEEVLQALRCELN